MNTVGRYLRREIISAVLFVLVGFLALFAFFDLINEIEDVGKGGYKIQHALGFVALGLPGRIHELLPIAVLIGTIFALSQFAAHSEYTAMRVAGLGRRRALAAISVVGIWFSLATALVGEVLVPQADLLAQKLRLAALGGTVGGHLRSGMWVRDTIKDESGKVQRLRFVNVGELLPDTSLHRIRIFEFDREFRLLQIVDAQTGQYTGPNRWQLSQIRETSLEPVRVAGDTVALRASPAQVGEREWLSELTPDILGVLMLNPQRMSIWSLWQYMHHLRENQQRTDRYEIALWRKLTYPLAALVMMALALPFAYMQVRAGGVGYRVFAGIMLGVAFHFLNSLFAHLGLLHLWPAWLAASIPGLAAATLALAMLAWVDRTR